MSDDQVQVVLEHFDDKFDALLEIIHLMNQNMQVLAKDEDLQEVKAEVVLIRQAITDTNKDLRKLEKRVTKLEAAA